MKIAVVGASGFVGSHVLNALAGRSGLEIVAASRSPMPEEDLPAGARHVVCDIATASAEDYDRLGRPDVLIHLAWAGLPNYMSLHHFEVELPMQYRFLRTMVEAGLPALLVVGTCYEYGMLAGELSEDAASIPTNPYALAKTTLRRQLEFLQGREPFSLTWARLFYTYGPGQSATSIYALLQAAIERGDATFPMSKGEQLRDYLPIETVAESLVSLAVLGEGAGVVNVCSGEPIAIRALVEQWLARFGQQITLDLGKYPYPSYEPLAFWGSRAKLDSILGSRRKSEQV